MTSNMDRSLDEILSERKQSNNRGRGRNGGNNGGSRRRDRRDDYPRDGIRKSYREDSRKIDEEWVHDRYDDDSRTDRPSWKNRASPERGSQSRGTRVRVENLHYELTQSDLEGLFQRIGPVTSVELLYDRAGRSEGVAYVTYEYFDDAKTALREFDGANAKGQPIRLTIVPGSRRNPLDSAVKPGSGRPLDERITRAPGKGRRRGDDYDDYDDEDGEGRDGVAAAARRGIDRYVPRNGGGGGVGGGSRSRSPMPRRREGGRRPGERRRRGGNNNGNNNNNRNGNNGSNNNSGGNNNSRRPRKTEEELDAEMADYFGEGGAGEQTAAASGAAPATTNAAPAATADTMEDDSDMIG